MKILTLTTLYPNAEMPNHGVFVEHRLRAYREKSGADIRVVAPIPWFPFSSNIFGSYGAFARAPKTETRYGVTVEHPRYAIPPKIGMTYAAYALERCFFKAAQKQLEQGWDFDLIDAHYLYPDGVAAQKVAERLGKPIVMTARGTDVSLIPNFPRQKSMILNAVRKADRVVCVAKALKDALIDLEAPEEKITVLRNGVDLKLFKPFDKTAMREKYGLPSDVKIIASVGHLITRKGHDLVIRAVENIPNTILIIVGAGPERKALENLALNLGVQTRVTFLGPIPNEQMAEIYSAADVLALASTREGWPNVLLEAMACGTPAVAAPIWGCGEVITAPAAGKLAKERTSQSITTALKDVLGHPPTRDETRTYAEGFSWDETSTGLHKLFLSAVKKKKMGAKTPQRPFKLSNNPSTPKLIVTIDTEEAFDWSSFDKEEKHRVCPTADITPFQELCEKIGVQPLYFLTHPLLEDDETVTYFRTLQKNGRANLGLHLHQWTTPAPASIAGQHVSEYYSFQKNLPQALYAQKLNVLSNAFQSAIGVKANAHRAGRYGVDENSYAALAAIGVTHDFSPSPAFDQSFAGGPDFTPMSNAPFNITVDSGDNIAVTPVCGARALRRTRWFLPQNGGASGFGVSNNIYANTIMPRITAPMRLTCEGTELDDLKALTKSLIKENTPVLTFSFHSTSFSLGGTPYAQNVDAIKKMLETTTRFFDFFKNDLGGAFLSLPALEDYYNGGAR